jgi:hypothetical protein
MKAFFNMGFASFGLEQSALFYPKLCGIHGHRSQKMVLGSPLAEFNPEKVSSFAAELSRGRHDSTNFAAKNNLSSDFGHTGTLVTNFLLDQQPNEPQPVGRESEAHPAISIIPSLDFERYHLPPIQGYKCRVPRIGESLNTAKPRPS